MSDPRDWSGQDWQEFCERFDTPQDVVDAGTIIGDIISEADDGNWNEVFGTDTPSEPDIE
jgi:hypothetical protein